MYFPEASDEAQYFSENYNFFNNFTSQEQQTGGFIGNNEVVEYTALEPLNGPQIASDELGVNLITHIEEYNTGEDGRHEYVQSMEQVPEEMALEGTDESAPRRDEEKNKVLGGNRICRVCGDKALGYNFNVITCESCKAFFRRNALKKKDFRCPSRNNCNITVTSRRYCQKCRLRKCFQAGMKPEYIMTEEQRAEKRRRLLERNDRKPERDNEGGSSDEGDSRSDQESGSSKAGLVGMDGNDSLESLQWFRSADGATPASTHAPPALSNGADHSPLVALPSPLESVTSSSAGSSENDPEDIEISIRLPKSVVIDILFNNTDGTGQAAALGQAVLSSVRVSAQNGTIASRTQNLTTGSVDPSPTTWEKTNGHPIQSADRSYDQALVPASTSSPIRYPNASSVSSLIDTNIDMDALDKLVAGMDGDLQLPVLSPRSLTIDLKYAKLDELLIANQIWDQEHTNISPLRTPSVDDFTMQDIANLAYFGSRCLLKQYGNLSAIRNLRSTDRYALLKTNVRPLCMLRSANGYNKDTNLFRMHYPGRDAFEVDKRKWGMKCNGLNQLIGSLPEKFRTDQALMLILGAITLFSPNRADVVDRAAVEAERQVYLDLLRDYLENTYGPGEAHWAYDYLTQLLSYLSSWLENEGCKIMFEFDPDSCEILLFELLEIA